MMKRWFAAAGFLVFLCSCAWAEYSPGYLMQPPSEVLEHLSRSFPHYTLEDYCEIYDTPAGDYGFAMLTAGDERLLVGYEEKDGKMSYWLKNHGAVMQGSEEAWFETRMKGSSFYGEDNTIKQDDGLSFSVIQLDNAGESYHESVAYHWEDGSFKLTGYKDWDEFYGEVAVKDGELHFKNWLEGWDFGKAYGFVQRDLRYVNFARLPKNIEEARKSITSAPQIVVGDFHPQTIRFTGGRKYAVYTGPGETYARSGNGKGQVSTNDWIEVFGRYGDWIMIQYDISAEQYRIGWIEADALPSNADVPELAFEMLDQRITQKCILTDDPLNSKKKILSLNEGTRVTSLANFGEHYYIEVAVDGRTYWGFVDADCITKG